MHIHSWYIGFIDTPTWQGNFQVRKIRLLFDRNVKIPRRNGTQTFNPILPFQLILSEYYRNDRAKINSGRANKFASRKNFFLLCRKIQRKCHFGRSRFFASSFSAFFHVSEEQARRGWREISSTMRASWSFRETRLHLFRETCQSRCV